MSVMAAATVLAAVTQVGLVDRAVGCQPEPGVCQYFWERRAFLDPISAPPPGGMVVGAQSMLLGFAYQWYQPPFDCTPAQGDFAREGGVWLIPGRAFWFEFDAAAPTARCRMMTDRAAA
ncbi:MAG: hypothetical protein AAF677_17175 [Pseudomonadota bacterium]